MVCTKSNNPTHICEAHRTSHALLHLPLALILMQYTLTCIFMHANTGKLVLSDTAYAKGVGFFDKVAINYGYRIFTEIDENPSLQRLIDDAEAEGYVFLTDQVRRKEGCGKNCKMEEMR